MTQSNGTKRRIEEKKIRIYEAALSLMEDRYDLAGIKVVDIAKKADVGKGTIYEYFDHKEQVISESIFYMLGEWIGRMEEIIEGAETFETGFIQVLEDLFVMMEKKHQIIFAFLTLQDFPKSSLEELEKIMIERKKEMQRLTMHLYKKIIARSLKEGVIHKNPDLYDGYFAVNSAMMYVLIYEEQRACGEDLLNVEGFEKEEVVKKAYRVYLKLLADNKGIHGRG